MHDFHSSGIIQAVSNRGKFIAIPAFALALAGAYYVSIIIFRWFQARNWLSIEAKILEINDPSSVGVEVSSLINRKKINAKYEFFFKGCRHTGAKIATGKGYQSQLHVELYECFKNENNIKIFVNPKNPDQSIVNRDIYWPEFIALLAIAVVGLITGIHTLGWITDYPY